SPLPFMHLVQRLKHIPRTGWLRFIENPESVAAHSYRLDLFGCLAPQDGVDREKCMFMGLVHDLAEAVVGDIPTYAGVLKEEKHRREALGFHYICDLLAPSHPEFGKKIISSWKEYEEGKTAEAKWMKEMDKFECMLQASEYEQDTFGEKNLEEFQGLSTKIHSHEGKEWLSILQGERR
ncbi:HD domain-containing protein 2-like protein, partial [Lentithecium fluviatile CBS 122367]